MSAVTIAVKPSAGHSPLRLGVEGLCFFEKGHERDFGAHADQQQQKELSFTTSSKSMTEKSIGHPAVPAIEWWTA